MLDAASPGFALLVAIVACLYAAVGHGGATGYLALFAFTAISAQAASTTALSLNVIVSLLALALFGRARWLDWRFAGPFVVGSVPMAYAGGRLALDGRQFDAVLGGVLLLASISLLLRRPADVADTRPCPWPARIGTGGAIGFLSGAIGIGGGIFLSPIVLLSRWSDAKRTAATSALFILVNSISGLAARGTTAASSLADSAWIVVAAATGALAGAYWGSHRAPEQWLRRLLGAVLLVASLKLIFAPG